MKADEFKVELASEPCGLQMRRCKRTRRGKKRRLEPFSDDSTSTTSAAVVTAATPPSPRRQKTTHSDDLTYEILATPPKNKIRCLSPTSALLVDPALPESIVNFDSSLLPLSTNRSRQRILRPLEVPKAPNNFTQFIMDDHENCNLYLSFESPRKIPSRRSTEASSTESSAGDETTSPHYTYLGYQDIDFEYESPDDLDTTEFFEKDFENIYRRAREDEIMTLSRSDLIERFIDLESRAGHYEFMLADAAGIPSVAKLQEELLQLQEENVALRCANKYLKSKLTEDSNKNSVVLLNDDIISDSDTSEDCGSGGVSDIDDRAELKKCQQCESCDSSNSDDDDDDDDDNNNVTRNREENQNDGSPDNLT